VRIVHAADAVNPINEILDIPESHFYVMNTMDTNNIWKEYHLDLKRFIVSKVKDHEVADDLLQEVFVKVHTKSTQLKDSTKLKSWLFTISRNLVMDYFKNLTQTQDVDDAILKTADDEVSQHSEEDCLPGIISHLPPKYKRPLYLSDIKGVKQKEIANKLNLPLPTVKSQIQRGRKLIVQGYMECCDYRLNNKGKLVGNRKEKVDCKLCH